MDITIELEHLEKQIALMSKVTQAISPENIGYRELTSVIGPLLTLNLSTAQSVKLLADNNHFRDMIILSRPFIEAIINIGYICAKGNEAVLKSKNYAYQKGYRDLFRGLNVNGLEISSSLIGHKDYIDQFVPENLQSALKEFSTTKGKEKSSWTNETAKEKLEVVGERYGAGVNGFLSFAFFNIYRDVSEIIHGSYYGMRIFLGMQNKDITAFKSSDEAAENFTTHQNKLATLIIQQINISIYSIIEILHKEFNTLSILDDLKNQSKREPDIYADKVKV